MIPVNQFNASHRTRNLIVAAAFKLLSAKAITDKIAKLSDDDPEMKSEDVHDSVHVTLKIPKLVYNALMEVCMNYNEQMRSMIHVAVKVYCEQNKKDLPERLYMPSVAVLEEKPAAYEAFMLDALSSLVSGLLIDLTDISQDYKLRRQLAFELAEKIMELGTNVVAEELIDKAMAEQLEKSKAK